jgi:CRP-like cAMP-binding protein
VLRASDLLAPLDDDARVALARRMRRLDFAAGEAIFHQGASGDSLYLVEHGEVGVRVAVDGSSAEVATLGPGEVFGEMSLLTGAPRTATCTARTEVRCWVVERAAFETLLAERPQLLEPLSATLAARQAALAARQAGLTGGGRVRIDADRSRLLGRMRELFRVGGREA